LLSGNRQILPHGIAVLINTREISLAGCFRVGRQSVVITLERLVRPISQHSVVPDHLLVAAENGVLPVCRSLGHVCSLGLCCVRKGHVARVCTDWGDRLSWRVVRRDCRKL